MKNVIQGTTLTGTGAVHVAPGAEITIRNPAGQLVPLWLDRAGTQPADNPFQADAEGHFRVYADSGWVHVRAQKDGSVREWRYVPLGSAAAMDIGEVYEALGAEVYSSVAGGLSESAEGDYFLVESEGALDLYRVVNGVAEQRAAGIDDNAILATRAYADGVAEEAESNATNAAVAAASSAYQQATEYSDSRLQAHRESGDHDARYLLQAGTKSVAEIGDDGILELTPGDGRCIRLADHGSARYVIRGFGAQCPVGWEVKIHVPRTVPDVGGTPNERGQAVVFADTRTGPGLDMTMTAYIDDGMAVYGYEACPDATDKDGSRCALDERLTFVHRGEGRWELVELPAPAEGRNSAGSWERHALGKQVVYSDDLTIHWVDRVEWLRTLWEYPVRCEFGPTDASMMLPVPSGLAFSSQPSEQARLRENIGMVGVSRDRLGDDVWVGVHRIQDTFEFTDEDAVTGISARVTCRWKPNPWTGALLAHRGRNSFDDAENVVESLATLSPWVAGVEIDVRFTSDGVPVLMHDATVDRTTNGSGPVESFTLAQLKALEAGAEVGGGATVPTLEEYLAACEGKGFRWIFLDLKGADTQSRIEAVIDVVAASPLQDRCILAPPSDLLAQALPWARDYDTEVILGRLALDDTTIDDALVQADTYNMTVALTHTQNGGYLAHRSAAAKFKAAGFLSGASTTNDMDALERAKRDNADFIFTDIAGELGGLFGS